MNEERLKALPGRLCQAKAVIEGEFTREYYPAPTDLQFKLGSQIMLLNNDAKERWVNGSLGLIQAIKTIEGRQVIQVRVQETCQAAPVTRFTWEVSRFTLKEGKMVSEPVGTFNQYPFRLAWAITIHKSQGKTFQRVILDLKDGVFSAGQIYVGLSRCTTLEGLVLRVPIAKQQVFTDPQILDLYTQLPQHRYSLTRTAAKIAYQARSL